MRLEHAFRLCKNFKDQAKFKAISDLVESRTPQECKDFLLKLSQKDKNGHQELQKED